MRVPLYKEKTNFLLLPSGYTVGLLKKRKAKHERATNNVFTP